MIKFFRRIRQALLSENKFSKYLLYAIGEIILVVIGILIALQINNWNENRKADKQEQKLLKQLKKDVLSNKDEVFELSKRLLINKVGIDSFISKLNEQEYDKTIPIYLAQTMRKADFNKASSGYNIMQNGGVSIISNELILKSILNLYENDLTDILYRQVNMNTSIDYIQKEFVNKLFVQAPNNLNIQFKELDVVPTEVFEPISFNKLIENTEFKNTLIQLRKIIEIRIASLGQTEVALNKTIEVLNASIKE